MGDHFLNFGAPIISAKRVKLSVSNLVFILTVISASVYMLHDRLSLKGVCLASRGLFSFWQMSDNISETVRDRKIVTMED